MTGMRKMDNRGMMTVEAACIVPIILMIIVIEIFFGIFLIDISSVKSETIRPVRRQTYGSSVRFLGSWPYPARHSTRGHRAVRRE